MGRSIWISSFVKRVDSSRVWLESIQLTLPLIVLISPLWAIKRNGCASFQFGNVFVENLEWIKANADRTFGSNRSVK
jgi:hypothetical protein